MNLDTIQYRKVLDLGLKLDNSAFGSNDTWNRATSFAGALGSAHNLPIVSAGTGLGVRDVQFTVPDEDTRTYKEWNELIMERAKGQMVVVKYVGLYYEPITDGLELSDEELEELFERADTKTARELR